MGETMSRLGLVLSAIASGGFTRHTHTPYCPAAPLAVAPGAADALRAFDYSRAPIAYRNRILPALESATHVVRFVRFPSAGLCRQRDGLVAGHYYHSKHEGEKPLVIVLPIFGSYTYPTRAMLRTLRRHYGGDCHLLQLLGEEYLLDWFGLAAIRTHEECNAKAREMAECMRVAVIDLRRVLDWAEARPEIDARRIAVIGFSMSAFLAALALGVEPRFRAGVIAFGGAHPADIFASCGGKPGMAKAAVMEKLGLTREAYYALIEAETDCNDPAHFSGLYRPERILYFDARYDSCMPARSRDDLWEAMGRPERYTFDYDHKSAFLAMTPLGRNFLRRKTVAFLDRVLAC